MTLLDAIKQRHTIRTYEGKAINGETLSILENMIAKFNQEANLHFQLINGKQDALSPFKIRYGKWIGVTNYIAMTGLDDETLDERCGYYGEQIVLWAQTQGLKTGWVETSCSEIPDNLIVAQNERLLPLSLCIGYSELNGNPHRVKSIEELSTVNGEMPDWFKNGMECAQLAPSAGNQQLFNIAWDRNKLSMTTKKGLLENVDMGIAKYHFEIGSGRKFA